MINSMHAKNIRVILWATCFINPESSNYDEAKKNGYLLNRGKTVKWYLI